MKTQTILLIEDDFLNRRRIKKVLEKQYNIIEAGNAAQAYEALNNNQIHLAIVDINLGQNAQEEGIRIGNSIKNEYLIPFIYLTAYDMPEITSKAIDTAPKSYITKPFKEVDLLMSISIALHHNATTTLQKTLTVKEDQYYTEIPIENIDYLESEGNYVLLYTDEKVYRYRSTIKEIYTMLPQNIFIQVHRAFIVNKTKVEKYNQKEIVICKKIIPVSIKYNG
ncbi:MAG TPA: response regulator transcription factor [Flavipsychrobacter sp.]|nr:response regulator transcription factor [Flavipsychrobacter sp.]